MGPVPLAATSTPRAGSNNGNNMNIDGAAGGQQAAADSVDDPKRTVTQLPIAQGPADFAHSHCLVAKLGHPTWHSTCHIVL
jgi:hypothetical protein